MARKSPLTEKQWAEIERRLLAGEKAAALANEFGINRSAISRRFSQQIATVKNVANQLFEADVALKSLPVAQQNQALTVLDDLKAISAHLGGAGKYGAMTAHRLNGIANMQLDKIDESELHDPESASFQIVKTVAGLTEVANKAAQTGINLLNANKDQIAKANEESIKPVPTDNRTKAAKIAGLIAVAKSRAENAADA
jgi:hypothetical protein